MKNFRESNLMNRFTICIYLFACLVSGYSVWQRINILNQLDDVVHYSPNLLLIKIRIFSCFFLSLIFVWSSKLWRHVLSIVLLLWVLGEFILWQISSQEAMRFAEIEKLPPPSIWGFDGGTWLDVFLLISACILLIEEFFQVYLKVITFSKRDKSLKV